MVAAPSGGKRRCTINIVSECCSSCGSKIMVHPFSEVDIETLKVTHLLQGLHAY